ncbi:cysteine hydrolase family protein [Ammoniphilus sp. YIM 78166]|uniref:cysteine hydrolase family protein n=1 Tax=Ammoniphilus sp. YIM 78166 TaxID=1644106 RepID=UPI001070679E|nr:cysteine hydrolase family protein [Ammoniphilus sp. YIM 78166]
MFLSKMAALIIVDVQKAFDDPSWGQRNNPQAETNIKQLLKKWRETERPVYHIQHVSKRSPSSLFYFEKETCEIKEEAKPLEGEPVLTKSVNSSFIGTHLEEFLRERGCDTVVVVGLTTNHCVETTTRMAGNLGFNTYLVSDATATFDRVGPDGRKYRAADIHQMTLVNLHEEFATIVDTRSIIEML